MKFKNSKRMPRTKKVRGWRAKRSFQCFNAMVACVKAWETVDVP